MEQIKDMLHKAFKRFPSVQGSGHALGSGVGNISTHFTGANFKSMELFNLCPEGQLL